MLTRETCQGCHRQNPLGFTVPNVTWAATVPPHLRDAALCIVCFDELATTVGVDWSTDVPIDWHPVSGVAFQRYQAATDDRVTL